MLHCPVADQVIWEINSGDAFSAAWAGVCEYAAVLDDPEDAKVGLRDIERGYIAYRRYVLDMVSTIFCICKRIQVSGVYGVQTAISHSLEEIGC